MLYPYFYHGLSSAAALFAIASASAKSPKAHPFLRAGDNAASAIAVADLPDGFLPPTDFEGIAEESGGGGSFVYVTYVKCIKPSSGTDGWVNDLIGVLTGVGFSLVGIAACAGTAGVGCAVVAVGASAGIDQLTKAAIKAGAPEALGQKFGGSEDDFYLSANGRKFSAEVEIGSQETKAMGAITFGLPKICLMEYDWGSGDDNMGCIETRKLGGIGHYGVVVASKEHGSVYEVELHIM